MNGRTFFVFSLLSLLLSTIACGSLEEQALEEPTPEATPEPGVETAFLFATDFASSGQLLTSGISDPTTIDNSGVAGLGSSAIVRIFDGLVYVLHDGFSVASSDNVQILDPANQFATVNQWSTGNGTNPQDLVVIGNRATISLYNPEQDSESVDANGNPADLIVMNLDTGEITDRISFFDSLNDDGSRLGRAAAMVLADDLLYVCLQDLEADFSHNAAGKIGVIDTDTNEIADVITLQGRNPVDIVYSPTEERLLVALQAPFDFALGNFDTSLPFGGIESIALLEDNRTALIPDEELGGYVERLAIVSDRVFAVVSEMDPVTFSFSSDVMVLQDDDEIADGASVFVSGSTDVRDIATDSLERLWISRRSINANDGLASDPQVDVFDTDSGAQIGTSLVPPVPVTSIAIGEI